ncbi:MAG: hypothetical protein WA705_12420 [Candidatus Ozemobacteraceae bacterium]
MSNQSPIKVDLQLCDKAVGNLLSRVDVTEKTMHLFGFSIAMDKDNGEVYVFLSSLKNGLKGVFIAKFTDSRVYESIKKTMDDQGF